MNKNIKYLIERLFDDDDETIFNNSNDQQLADYILLQEQLKVIKWFNENVELNGINGKNLSDTEPFVLNEGITITYEHNKPCVIIDKTDNRIQITEISFRTPIPYWFNIKYINGKVEFERTELANMPYKIDGSLRFTSCDFNAFPKNMPDVNGSLYIYTCHNIKSCEGLTHLLNLKTFYIEFSLSFKTTKGLPLNVVRLHISNCRPFKYLEDLNKDYMKSLSLIGLENLNSLDGCPRYIEEDLIISSCALTTLKGAPDYVGRNFICQYCGLRSLEIPNTRTNGFTVTGNKLTSLRGGPKEVGGKYEANKNNLKTLDAENTMMTGFDAIFNVKGNPNLRTLENAPLGVNPNCILHNKLKT